MGIFELRNCVKKIKRLYLFLDYDGTLVPLAPVPEEAVPSPFLLDLLKRLCECPELRVAVVSGRSVDDLIKLLPVPGL